MRVRQNFDGQDPKAYSVKEFAKLYRLGLTTVYEEIKAGRLKARKVASKSLVMRADAEAWAMALPELKPAA